MSRPVFPFHAPDISALSRSLLKQWAEQPAPPSHVEMLNMLARAIGHQNFQHFRAVSEASHPVAAIAPEAAPAAAAIDPVNKHLLRHFDAAGRMLRWPSKHKEQLPCLWTVWARIPAGRDMSEREVNEFIKQGESFGDHVLLRRELVNYKLLDRTLDCRIYRRNEQPVPAEVAPLLVEALRRAAA
ncbi:DUF2087 domain-containing protein [Chitinimonas sp.]|uniref:DUF2087 domain-containing protein n=1 Tax=Chitinimonas sp. TaxID=1934313 RepID=UPI0035ADD3A1